MIYMTNWIERLQKDFRRITRMRGTMPNEESVLLLMGKTAMDKKSYLRLVPKTNFSSVFARFRILILILIKTQIIFWFEINAKIVNNIPLP